jgi:hypothetical protein
MERTEDAFVLVLLRQMAQILQENLLEPGYDIYTYRSDILGAPICQ